MIFIEDTYKVEQKDNLLRVTPSWDMPEYLPEVFMEIKQALDITAEEMEQKILAGFDLNSHHFYRQAADEDFPFVSLEFCDDFELGGTVIKIYIKDNTRGGVFVITTQHSLEAAEGHGIRFWNSLKTMSII